MEEKANDQQKKLRGVLQPTEFNYFNKRGMIQSIHIHRSNQNSDLDRFDSGLVQELQLGLNLQILGGWAASASANGSHLYKEDLQDAQQDQEPPLPSTQ